MGHRSMALVGLLALGALLATLPAAALYAVEPSAGLPTGTARVSVATGGGQASAASSQPAISADGRYVAFQSEAADLVDGDTNGKSDVFLHDRQTGETVRVSVSSAGVQANGDSFAPAISADGRTIVFESRATNLVPEDGNPISDIYLHDRQTLRTALITSGLAGAAANGHSFAPALSADGRWVAFESEASNLVDGDTNGMKDVFLYGLPAGPLSRVSIASDGTQADQNSFDACVSADGRFVAFASWATTLRLPDNQDLNDASDVFVRDTWNGRTELVSVRSSGAQGDDYSELPAISANGRYVAFASVAENLVSLDWNYAEDIFVRDRAAGTTERVSVASDGTEGDGDSFRTAISADGRYVAFESKSGNLVPGDAIPNSRDIFRHDRWTGRTICLSVDAAGALGDGGSFRPALSAEGEATAFDSLAENLVPDDSNAVSDVFVRSLPPTQRVYLPLAVK